MAYYAQLDEANYVTQVIRVDDEHESDSNYLTSLFGEDVNFVQTSYTGRIRKNFAGVGFTYDPILDAFISPQPYPSWMLNEETCGWEPPTPYPIDDKIYRWDEATLSWVELD